MRDLTLDFAAILDELDFVKGQLARLPTRKDLARMALATLGGGKALGIVSGLVSHQGPCEAGARFAIRGSEPTS
jgi:hypothetical protein